MPVSEGAGGVGRGKRRQGRDVCRETGWGGCSSLLVLLVEWLVFSAPQRWLGQPGAGEGGSTGSWPEDFRAADGWGRTVIDASCASHIGWGNQCYPSVKRKTPRCQHRGVLNGSNYLGLLAGGRTRTDEAKRA